MKARVEDLSWRLFFALLAFSFASTTHEIAIGNFDNVGLAPQMVTMEMVGNALEAVGWAMVFILSFRDDRLLVPELCLFLAGMFFFDVQTTWTLDMPLPPYFLIWGTLLAAVQVWAAARQSKRRTQTEIVASNSGRV